MNRKRVWNLLQMIFFGGLIVVGSLLLSKEATADLSELEKFEGVIREKGITKNKSSRTYSDVFYIKLEGLDQILATYNMSQTYTDYDAKLQVGEKVLVYFMRSPYPDRPNINTYRIEKNSEVIMSEEGFKKRSRTGLVIAVAGLILILIMGYFRDKKLRFVKTTGRSGNE
jgi:hypothetical protein